MSDRSQRDQFDAHLAEIIDKTAELELLDLIANDDELRDARHAAEETVRLLARAADDYVVGKAPSAAAVVAQPTQTAASTPATDATATTQASLGPENSENTVAATADAANAADAPTLVNPTLVNPTLVNPASPNPASPNPAPSSPQFAPAPGVVSDKRHVAIWVAVSVAAVLGVVILLWSPTSKKAWRSSTETGSLRGNVVKVESPDETSRVEICAGNEGDCRIAKTGMRVDSGSLVRTNSRARARLVLDGGGSIALDRATVVVLARDGGALLELKAGTIAVETDEAEAGKLVVEFPLGHVELDRAKCAITSNSTHALVEVTRGRVRLYDRDEHTQTLRAGATGRIKPDRGISVTYSRSIGDAISDNESVGEKLDESELSRGLGELRAKKPGDTSERDNAVRLTRHHVDVHIVGAIAKTEIDETFTNDTNDVLEGIFRFPLPADAQIERLALEVDGRLVEGAFTDRERASAIWRGSIVHAAPQLRAQIRDEIIWVPGPWRDPALLEWQRGNRFELRIYPIPKQGSRRIVLSYTQVVSGSTGARRYSYPLPRQAGDLRGVEDFSFALEMRGHDASRPPTVIGYDGKLSSASSDVANFSLSERQFQPRGDLVVDYELPQDQKDLVAWAHQPKAVGENPYVALLLRPRLPSAAEQLPQAYAFVVDTSRSMIGESLRRASALTVRMIRELSSDSRVVVLACDSECRRWPDGLLNGGKLASESAQRWLLTQSAEGASDLAGAIDSALDALGHGSSVHRQVVYVGDGTPTAGPTRPATIAKEVLRRIGAAEASVVAVAVGADSDLESLRALARGGRGVVVPYVPGTTVARASYAALAATFGTRLVDAKIELPPGVVGVAPEQIGTIAAGDELLVVGRLTGPEVRGDVVLRGRADDHDFEQRYSVEVRAVAGESNAFVPRLYAATRISDLERRSDGAAKTEAIELSRRFSVASRYTSLLVLESQAMFDAFGLDNRRKSEVWTGELEASGTSSASAELDEESQPEAYQATEAKKEIGQAGNARMRAGGAAAPAAAFEGSAPSVAAPAAAPAAKSSGATSARREASIAADEAWSPRPVPSSPPQRRMIPMRRIWERTGEVMIGKTSPSAASHDKILAAEREVMLNPDRRGGVKQLLDLYAKSGDLAKANDLAEQWSQRDPLDVEALVARADLAARRGDRTLAIRILGSVVDVRPSDVGAQQRLSRLYRWQGQPERACRFSLALAEFRPNDEKALAEALRCLNDGGKTELSQEVRGTVTEGVLRVTERLLAQPRTVDRLNGDLRLTAHWQSNDSVDVDLSLIDPDAHRVSWLGAPTRAVISATTVTSQREEGLALRGGRPGEYLIEVSRGSGAGKVQGTIVIHAAGTQREIPFTLEGDRATVGVVRIATVPRLVPLSLPAALRMAE